MIQREGIGKTFTEEPHTATLQRNPHHPSPILHDQMQVTRHAAKESLRARLVSAPARCHGHRRWWVHSGTHTLAQRRADARRGGAPAGSMPVPQIWGRPAELPCAGRRNLDPWGLGAVAADHCGLCLSLVRLSGMPPECSHQCKWIESLCLGRQIIVQASIHDSRIAT